LSSESVWETAPLPANVRVGRDLYFERRRQTFRRFNSDRDPALVIGDRVRIYTWTTFSLESDAELTIGDDCVLVGATFMCADRTSVGNRVVISLNAAIADCDFHPLDPALRQIDAIANAPEGDPSSRPLVESQPVEIGDDVRIGIGAIILKGVSIGRGAQVMPGTVVSSDVPPGATVEGNPGRLRQ
jgi:acetyltransferase-like isoleucine patch superfamily enzyme